MSRAKKNRLGLFRISVEFMRRFLRFYTKRIQFDVITEVNKIICNECSQIFGIMIGSPNSTIPIAEEIAFNSNTTTNKVENFLLYMYRRTQ